MRAIAILMMFTAGNLLADDSKLKVKVGDAFPDASVKSTLVDNLKKKPMDLSIADFKGKVVVIFFYPRAMTSGCTTESCGFRDLAKEFPEGSILLGASNDTVAKNQEFITKEMLPYALLCDTENKLIKDLGILSAKGNAAQRLTFIVNKEGKIAKIYDKVNVKDHPKEVLAEVKTMVKK